MDAETQRQTPKLRTNLDTNFLKLFAILTMVVDHVGTVFFPQHPEFRWVGRLAFPIFCYCLTVGLMYTRDIRRYLGRLALFAVVSQPFFALAFHPHNFWEELTSWNIFVTLFFSLLAIYGVKERKWWWFLLGVLAINVLNADYANTGVILTLIFYLCRNIFHFNRLSGFFCRREGGITALRTISAYLQPARRSLAACASVSDDRHPVDSRVIFDNLQNLRHSVIGRSEIVKMPNGNSPRLRGEIRSVTLSVIIIDIPIVIRNIPVVINA